MCHQNGIPMTDGLRAGLTAPNKRVNISHAYIRRVINAVQTGTHPFHLAAGEEKATIENPYPTLKDLSLLVLNVGFHLKLTTHNMDVIVCTLKTIDKLQHIFETATYSKDSTELAMCREPAIHLSSKLWENGWPTWFTLSHYHAENTRWVHDVAPPYGGTRHYS